MNFEAIRDYAIIERNLIERESGQKTKYLIKSKLIFVHNSQKKRICMKLNEIDQSVFSSFNFDFIHPVPSKWGKHGWTLFYYENLPEELVFDALSCALVYVKTFKSLIG